MNDTPKSTAYKIVTFNRWNFGKGRFTSYWEGNPHKLSYNKSSIITPKIKSSYLYVFDTIENARKYLFASETVLFELTFKSWHIWEVECENLKELVRNDIGWPIFVSVFLEEQEFYSDSPALKDSKNPYSMPSYMIPNGTMTCKSLKYLRDIS